MNLELEILKRYSKAGALKIVKWISADKKRFTELMELFLSADNSTSMRASWILSKYAEKNPAAIMPWLPKMIRRASEKNIHDAVKRNVIRSLQFVSIPRSLQGKVANLCFQFLENQKESIAVKAFSMTVLANIAQDEPDLQQEIQLVVTQMLPYGSAGIQARAKKVLKQLSK